MGVAPNGDTEGFPNGFDVGCDEGAPNGFGALTVVAGVAKGLNGALLAGPDEEAVDVGVGKKVFRGAGEDVAANGLSFWSC